MRPIPILITLLALTATVSAADDVLQLRSGRLVVGTIVATDETGVTVRTDAGEARFDWGALTPISEYEVRTERIAPDDAAGRVDLAERCIRSGLYPYARKELSLARGLGYEDAERLEALMETATRAEAESAFAAIDQLMAEEDYETALEEVRRYLLQAPPGTEHVTRARALANDLLRRIENRKVREAEEEKAAADAAKGEAIAKRVQAMLDDVEKSRAAANEAFAEALKYGEIGNRTRTRKGYEEAEKHLISAYRTLAKLQRTVRRGPANEKAEELKEVVRKKLVEVYVGLAGMYVEDRNYKSGSEYVAKALYLDPVNKAALEMRREIDENRLTRKASGITNTPGGPRTTGPGGVSSSGK